MGYSPWGRKESDTTEPLNTTSVLLLGHSAKTHQCLMLSEKKEIRGN